MQEYGISAAFCEVNHMLSSKSVPPQRIIKRRIEIYKPCDVNKYLYFVLEPLVFGIAESETFVSQFTFNSN